jgi:hypothetical protein
MAAWDAVLEQFPISLPMLDYSAVVCVDDCAVVEAASRMFTLSRDWIVVIFLNGMVEAGLIKSWLCNTRVINGVWQRTLIVTPDLGLVEHLFDWNADLHLVHWESSIDEEMLALREMEGDKLFSPVHRLSLTRQILENGISILLAEPGSVWTSDPFLSLPQERTWDIAAAWDRNQYSLKLAFLRSTTATCDALQATEALSKDFISECKYSSQCRMGEELDYVSQIFTEYVRLNQIGVVVLELDPDDHASDIWYLKRTITSECIMPTSIRAADKGSKSSCTETRMQQFGHWYVTDYQSTCSIHSIADIVRSVQKWLRCGNIYLNGNRGAGYGAIATDHENEYFFARPLHESAVVYSFEPSADLAFELRLAARFGVLVHVFATNPAAFEQYLAVNELLVDSKTQRELTTPKNLDIARYRELILETQLKPEQLQFYPYALKTGQSRAKIQEKSLTEIMRDLGHVHVELLKLNVQATAEQVAQMLTSRPKYFVSGPLLSAKLHDKSNITNYKAVDIRGGSVTWMPSRYVHKNPTDLLYDIKLLLIKKTLDCI